MGDSQTKQFGEKYLDKLTGQLDRKAPVFGESLFAGAGDTTKNAWATGANNARSLVNSGGFTDPMRSAMNTFGTVGAGYGALAGNGGFSAGQREAMGNLRGLGDTYGELATAYDPNSAAYRTLRGNLSDDVLTDAASLGASNGRYGARSFYEGATEGLTNALAGLDYTNMQNDVNNRFRAADSQAGLYNNLFGMGQQGIGNQFAALAGQQGAATSLFGAGQQGIENTQGAIDRLGAIGAAQDADAQGRLLGRADLHDRRTGAELDWLTQIGAAFGGPGAATGAADQPDWWQQLLGYGVNAAGNAAKAWWQP